ncbi:MAG: molybdopterin-dependent oxidoreductase [Clostridiales Family XIII bacterium]|jgi:hypothetical protein|nr:molybdopterin-dependent oxidoreductase [Clostridiales Family XIII bacterium]
MKHRVLIFMVLALVSLVAMTGCDGANTDGSEPDYLDSEITINGLAEDTFTVKISELASLECVKEKVESTRSNGDKVKLTAYGPLLDTFLARYDKKQTDFTSIRFYATDGYAIAIPGEMLEKREVILAYMDGGKAFDQESKPLRVVVPGERAMYWAKMVNRIDFEQDGEGNFTEKIVFLDAALPEMAGEYSEEEGGNIVSTAALLERFGGGADKVTMYAADGLTKNETAENFLKGYIKYTGKNIPQFCSPELPEGMNLNGIVSIRSGNALFYSLDRAATILPEREAGDDLNVKGVGLTDIIKGNSFRTAATYELTTRAGEKTSFFEHDMTKGVFVRDEGIWSFYVDDDTQVKDVMSIEAVT